MKRTKINVKKRLLRIPILLCDKHLRKKQKEFIVKTSDRCCFQSIKSKKSIEPIVGNTNDAIHTLISSDLDLMIINNNALIRKTVRK